MKRGIHRQHVVPQGTRSSPGGHPASPSAWNPWHLQPSTKENWRPWNAGFGGERGHTVMARAEERLKAEKKMLASWFSLKSLRKKSAVNEETPFASLETDSGDAWI